MSRGADRRDEIGPAVIGAAGIALLVGTALLLAAIPYAAGVLAVAQLPHPGGLRDLGLGQLLVGAGGAFLIYALAEIPAEMVGGTVATWWRLQDQTGSISSKVSARTAGAVTAQLLEGALLTLLLALWVTATIVGAVLVALVTVTLETLLEPVVARWSQA